MDHAVRLRVWLAIAAVAVGLYLVGRWQGAASVADLATIQSAHVALRAGRAYRARLDSLRHLEQQQVVFSRQWRQRADSLRAIAIHRDTIVRSDTSAASLWRATANAEHEGVVQCGLALQTCQERAQSAEARAQALDTLLSGVLRVKECHILFVKCPSRVATGLVFLGVGLTGGALLTR